MYFFSFINFDRATLDMLPEKSTQWYFRFEWQAFIQAEPKTFALAQVIQLINWLFYKQMKI